MRIDPSNYIWWLVSRSAGIVALGLISLAVLLGPLGARRVLADQGGLIVHDDGDVELIGPIDERPRMRLRVPVKAA